jgi:hypothetical protein
MVRKGLMMRKTGLGLVSLMVLVPGGVMAQAPVFSAARVSADIRTIASDAFEGRARHPRGSENGRLADRAIQGGGFAARGRQGRRCARLDPGRALAAFRLHRPAAGQRGRVGPWVQGTQIALRPPQNGGNSYDLTKAPLVLWAMGVRAGAALG